MALHIYSHNHKKFKFQNRIYKTNLLKNGGSSRSRDVDHIVCQTQNFVNSVRSMINERENLN